MGEGKWKRFRMLPTVESCNCGNRQGWRNWSLEERLVKSLKAACLGVHVRYISQLWEHFFKQLPKRKPAYSLLRTASFLVIPWQAVHKTAVGSFYVVLFFSFVVSKTLQPASASRSATKTSVFIFAAPAQEGPDPPAGPLGVTAPQ